MAVDTPHAFRVDYVPRIEGEAGVEVVTSGEEVTHLRLRIFEPPRCLDSALVGQPYHEAPGIVSRLCGICPLSHQIAAVQALENAMGLVPTPQTVALRRILGLAQWLQSHAVQIYLMAAPDLLGCDGAFALASYHPDLVQRALRLKKLGSELTRAVSGPRAAFPSLEVNGFRRLPSPSALARVRARLERARQDATDTVTLVRGLDFPAFPRCAELVALRDKGGYPVNSGRIVSTEGLGVESTAFRRILQARPAPFSTAVYWQVAGRDSFMVGPLARLNLNADRLSPAGAQALRSCGAALPSHNPFHSVIARAVELVQAIEECSHLIDDLNPKLEDSRFEVRAGEGAACIEAPRGVLYHSYRLDASGTVQAAEVIAPTSCNVLNIEEDLRTLAPLVEHLPEEQQKRQLEMLVRSYDPCLSCSPRIPWVDIHCDQ